MATARAATLANWYVLVESGGERGKPCWAGGPDRRRESSVDGDHLTIVPGGVPGEHDDVDVIAEEPDRPVCVEGVDPPAVVGDERDVRPFALPGVAGREDPRVGRR